VLGLPHARGGVSHSHACLHPRQVSSPRPWGCFPLIIDEMDHLVVFPTPVGVFLPHPRRTQHQGCLPHARGGVSSSVSSRSLLFVSSPRPWGCFCCLIKEYPRESVFPTPVGVFPHGSVTVLVRDRLPHARGGVSLRVAAVALAFVSSPRPWGCFCCMKKPGIAKAVFPTPVGVFLEDLLCPSSERSLPHARGGVSYACQNGISSSGSSPRPWGCFLLINLLYMLVNVFPTPVGVFLKLEQLRAL